jgi:hypothetical protein
MAVYFTDQYVDGTDAYRAPVGIGHGRLRKKRAAISTMALTTDSIRWMTFKSSDRLYDLVVSGDGGSTAGAIDIGLYLSGNRHDGALIDADLFASALTVSAAIARVDQFEESAVLSEFNRGWQMWEIAAVGAGTDVVDPQTQYDIVSVPTLSLSVANTILVMEALYTSGD